MEKVCAVVLAAGKGTRMKSKIPKVLMPLAGKPIIIWTLEILQMVGIEKTYVVIGFKGDLVKKVVENSSRKVTFVRQIHLLGTGHSVKLFLKHCKPKCKTLLVLYGDDSGLYKPESIKEFIYSHLRSKRKASFLTSTRITPSEIGGLKISQNGDILGVLSKSELEKKSVGKHQVLCGAFCFNTTWLKNKISELEKSSRSGEYPLPGLIQIALDEGKPIRSSSLKDPNEWHSINTLEELREAEKKKLITHNE